MRTDSPEQTRSLMLQRQKVVEPAVAAADWYDHLFLPALESIRAQNMPKLFPKSTDTDLYLRVHAQHRELVAAGAPHNVDDAVASTGSANSKKLKAKTRRATEDVKEVLEEVKETLTDKGYQ